MRDFHHASNFLWFLPVPHFLSLNSWQIWDIGVRKGNIKLFTVLFKAGLNLIWSYYTFTINSVGILMDEGIFFFFQNSIFKPLKRQVIKHILPLVLVVKCLWMVVQHHAVSGAGKLPRASGDHMFRIEVGAAGEGIWETLFPVSNQHSIHQSPKLVKVTAPLTAH